MSLTCCIEHNMQLNEERARLVVVSRDVPLWHQTVQVSVFVEITGTSSTWHYVHTLWLLLTTELRRSSYHYVCAITKNSGRHFYHVHADGQKAERWENLVQDVPLDLNTC